MGVHTFICKSSGKSKWTAKKYSKEGGSEESNAAEAGSEWELRKALRELAVSSGEAGGVTTSFTLVKPKSAVYQVVIGGAVMVSGGAVGAAAPAAGGAAAAEEAPAKVEEEEEEEEGMEFNLFD